MSRNELPSIFTWTITPKNRRVLKKTQLSSKGEKLRSQPREKDPVLDSNECENLEGDENNVVDVNFDKKIRKDQACQFLCITPNGVVSFCSNLYCGFISYPAIALMHVYVTQANFTTKPRFEIKNKRSFTEMNSQGSRVEKNTHAQNVQMQKILFTNEACW